MRRLSVKYVLAMAVLVAMILGTAVPADGTSKKTDGVQESGAKTTRGEKATVETAYRLMKKGQKRLSELKDYTTIFHKQEYVDEELLPEEVIRMKVRLKPRRIYMKWIGEVNKGQELLWGKGWNDGQIRVHPSGWLGLVTTNVDPEGSTAMEDNRHSVADAGFGNTINLLVRDLEVAREHPEYVRIIEDLGEKKIYGQKAAGFDAKLRKGEYGKFYAFRARVWIHKKLKLPVRVQIWDEEDGKVRLVENYGYEEIKTDVGLTDKDFDPDNPEYDF